MVNNGNRFNGERLIYAAAAAATVGCTIERVRKQVNLYLIPSLISYARAVRNDRVTESTLNLFIIQAIGKWISIRNNNPFELIFLGSRLLFHAIQHRFFLKIDSNN